jgi:hypothetical protein
MNPPAPALLDHIKQDPNPVIRKFIASQVSTSGVANNAVQARRENSRARDPLAARPPTANVRCSRNGHDPVLARGCYVFVLLLVVLGLSSAGHDDVTARHAFHQLCPCGFAAAVMVQAELEGLVSGHGGILPR